MSEKKSALKKNLFNLPGLGAVGDLWGNLTVANLSVRREAKGLMFHELAMATREGVPVSDALGLVAQTWHERQYEETGGKRQGADTRSWLGIHLLVLILFSCLTCGLFLFLFMSPPMSDPERVARIFALRPEKYLRKGFSLSQAMRKCPLDYSREEIALIEIAERSDKLPEGLRRMADFQVVDLRHTRASSTIAYPLIVGITTFNLVVFILLKVMPRFTDIFQQLGAELPGITTAVITLSHIAFHNIVFLPLVSLAICFIIFRALMNGNSLMRTVIAFFFISSIALFVFGIIVAAVDESGVFRSSSMPSSIRVQSDLFEIALGLLGSLIVTIVLLPIAIILISLVERVVVYIEKMVGAVCSWIPFIRTVARTERHGRWLAALSMMLETNETESAALRQAASVGGSRFAGASEIAAGLVERGIPFPEAIQKAKILPRQLAARTSSALYGKDLPARLREVAEEQNTLALDHAARAAKITEVLFILFIGLVAFLIVAAVYTALFSIPGIVPFTLE